MRQSLRVYPRKDKSGSEWVWKSVVQHGDVPKAGSEFWLHVLSRASHVTGCIQIEENIREDLLEATELEVDLLL